MKIFRYLVRVVNVSGLSVDELRTDDRREGEQYCRVAVEDGCRSATLLLSGGGQVVSWWNREELVRWREVCSDG